MQESVIATFNDVQFIQGVTPMTQANWQEYFGTTLKSGIYSGFGQGIKRDGSITPHVIYDGVAIANGIRAEIETELGYTDIGFLDAYGDVLDRFICLRIHFLSETAELIKKESIAEKAYTAEQTNDMLMRTMLQFEYDESYMCTRNDQYYDIPLFYQSKYNTWLYLGRDLRRIINADPIYTLNPIKNDFHKTGQSQYKLVSGANYYSASIDPTYIFPDTVDVTKMAVLTIETQAETREIRLSKIPYLNNFIASSAVSGNPVPESLSSGYKVNYIFSTESWTETDTYYSYTVPARTKKVFRLSFRGAQYSHTEGYADYDYDFNFFVEEIYNYQSTLWGAIGGNITDQIDLSTKLDELSQSTTDISETLALKSPIESPAFTGTPTAPTPASGDNSTKLATTAFVSSAVSSKAPIASPAFTGTPTAPTPESGDNSTRLATTAFVQSLIPSVDGFAPLASPAFTGTPTAPTPASSDNSTKLATTAFVQSLIPSVDGFAPLASPAFTGEPTAPTPASDDNSTKLATTAFVKSVIPDVPIVSPAKHIDYIDYFVDSSNGDDNNDGTVSSKPVKNIQTAINKCPIGGKCHIHVFDGTYNRIYIPRDKYVLITAYKSSYGQEQGIVNLYYEGEFNSEVSVVFVEGTLEIREVKLTITSGIKTFPMSVRNGGKLFVNYKDVYTTIGGDCTLSLINGSDYYSSLLVDNSSSAVLMPKTLFINSAITCAGSSHVSLLVRPNGAIKSSYIPVFDVRGGGILSYVGSDVSGGSQTVRSDGTSLVLLGEFSQD